MQPHRVLEAYFNDLLRPSVEQPAPVDRRAVRLAPQAAVTRCDAGAAEHREPSDSDHVISVDGEVSMVGNGDSDEYRAGDDLSAAPTAEPPGWAAESFQILPFRAAGVDLAVRLTDLASIARWTGAARVIPGQPLWQRGLYLHHAEVVSVVDLSTLIRLPSIPVTAAACYLLLIGGGAWGLPCDCLQRPRWVHADQVRWRAGGTARPWSYGILIEELTLLLNVDALLQMFGTKDA